MNPRPPLTEKTLTAVQGEARRAVLKHGRVNTPLGDLSRERKLTVLVEEIGEVARAISYDHDDCNLRAELIQVAAVAAMWAQSEEPAVHDGRTV